MDKQTTVAQHMTREPHSIGADQTIEVAKQLMYANAIRHLPVIDGTKCIGVISDRDLKLAFAVDKEHAGAVLVRDACSAGLYSVAPTAILSDVAMVMYREGYGCAVVEEQGRVVGIFTTLDACRVIAEEL